MAVTDLDLGRYKLGWSDAEDYVFKPKKGLSTDIVNEMSWMKGEPDWMRDYRLKSLKHFERRPMPNWGGDMSGIYLGGASEAAMRAAARFADVYLMWGEPVERMADRAAAAKKLAAEEFGRELAVGTRFQIVCREDDRTARADAEELVSAIAEDYGRRLRAHADRTDSVGQARQNELWGGDEWLTDTLWNGFARARMGAAVALVGSGERIRAALDEFVDAGIDTFILSGYRHDEEAERVGRHLMPLLG